MKSFYEFLNDTEMSKNVLEEGQPRIKKETHVKAIRSHISQFTDEPWMET